MNFIKYFKDNSYDRKLEAFGFEYSTKSGDDESGTLIYAMNLEDKKLHLEVSYSTWSNDPLYEITLYYLDSQTRDLNNIYSGQSGAFEDVYNDFEQFILGEQ